MIRFQKLVLHNIQKHEHLELDLDHDINAIIGSSDSGKSAIIRALSFVMFNKPTSAELRTVYTDDNGSVQQTKESYVVLFFNKDGVNHVVERYVSNTKNTYKLDGEIYKSFGRSVPEPIANLLDLDATLNFQGQYDTPFLLSYPAGEVSRIFNELLGLSVASDLSNVINSDIRKIRSEIDRDNKDVNELTSKIDSMGSTSDIERTQHEIDIICNELYNTHEKGLKIELILNNVNKIETQSVYRFKNTIKEIGNDLNTISTTIDEISSIQNKMNIIGGIISGYWSVRVVTVPILDDLSVYVSDLQSIQDKIITIGGLIKKVKLVEQELCEINKEQLNIESELKTFKICETCHRPLE